MHQHSLRTPGGNPLARSSMICIGIGHATAPAELRERFAFSPESIVAALADARSEAGIERMVIISTCHRTEFYAELAECQPSTEGLVPAREGIRLCNWISGRTRVSSEVVMQHAYIYHGDAAVRHLFRLASGLESPVPGEPQIIGQIAVALRHSIAAHAASPMLKRVFKEAVRIGERARASAWSRHRAANIGTAAASAAMLAIGQGGHSIADARIAVVGAGELGALAVSALAAAGATDLTVLNRSGQRAAALAERYGVTTRGLDEISCCLVESDAAIFAMSGMKLMAGVEMLTGVMAARGGSGLTLIDVALPRNVDPLVKSLPDLSLLDIDDIAKLGSELYADRASLSASVETIVEEGLSALRSRFMTPSQAPRYSLMAQ